MEYYNVYEILGKVVNTPLKQVLKPMYKISGL